HQCGEGADVENAFDGPGSNLGGHGQVMPFCNQIRTNEFSRATEERETSEAYNRRTDKTKVRGLRSYWSKKDLPANGAQNVADVNQRNRTDDMPDIDLVSFIPEGGPVERFPMADLDVDQRHKHEQRCASNKNAFSVH